MPTHLVWPADHFEVGTVAEPAAYEDGDSQVPVRSLDCASFWADKPPNVHTRTFQGVEHVEMGSHKPAQVREREGGKSRSPLRFASLLPPSSAIL